MMKTNTDVKKFFHGHAECENCERALRFDQFQSLWVAVTDSYDASFKCDEQLHSPVREA